MILKLILIKFDGSIIIYYWTIYKYLILLTNLTVSTWKKKYCTSIKNKVKSLNMNIILEIDYIRLN